MATVNPLGAIKLKTFTEADNFNFRQFGRDFNLNSLLVLFDSGEDIDGILTNQLIANGDEFDTGWLKPGKFHASLYAAVKTDQPVDFIFEESMDGTNAATRKVQNVVANSGVDADIDTLNFEITRPYFKIRVKNSSGFAQTVNLVTVTISPL